MHRRKQNMFVFYPGADYGEIWGFPELGYLYWVDQFNNPIKFNYPSFHFKCNVNNNPETPWFVGTMVDPLDHTGQSGFTNGAATVVQEIVGDVYNLSSYHLSYFDWHDYGWSNMSAAENAAAYYREGAPDTDWAWGINAYIMDTTFDSYNINDGLFVYYKYDETQGIVLDWYYWPNANGTLSCDVIIDQNAHLFVNESYGDIVPWDDEVFVYR